MSENILENTFVFKFETNKTKLFRCFGGKSLKSISIYSNGFNLPLDFLRVKINNKEIKLINVLNGFSIGSVKYKITDDLYNENVGEVMHVEIDYYYMALNDKECFLVCDCECNLSRLLTKGDNFYLSNSKNKTL